MISDPDAPTVQRAGGGEAYYLEWINMQVPAAFDQETPVNKVLRQRRKDRETEKEREPDRRREIEE